MDPPGLIMTQQVVFAAVAGPHTFVHYHDQDDYNDIIVDEQDLRDKGIPFEILAGFQAPIEPLGQPEPEAPHYVYGTKKRNKPRNSKHRRRRR